MLSASMQDAQMDFGEILYHICLPAKSIHLVSVSQFDYNIRVPSPARLIAGIERVHISQDVPSYIYRIWLL